MIESMYQYMSSLLLERGFFEVNGSVSRYLGPNEYRVLEDEGIISVERDFDGSNEEKNQVLDHIQGLSKRYSLTGANIRGGKLKVFLTRPGDDAEEEAIRIDFLTQSIERGIRDITGANAPVAEGSASAPFVGTRHPGSGGEIIQQTGRAAEEPAPEETVDVQQGENRKAKTLPVKEREPASPDGKEKIRTRVGSHYIPPHENPHVPGYQEPLTVSIIDRRFSFAGFLGALLGAVLGAILMGIVRTMGLPAHYAAFFVPFLVILLYRILADHQMPISLGILLVLASLLMGSVLTSTIDILASGNPGVINALRQGLRSHVDNENYYVFNVWLKYGMSVLTAAIPAILLLTGGKKRTIVY